MVSAISQIYIDMIKAFRADCEILLDKLKKENNNSWDTFLKIWFSMNFNYVYEKKSFSKHGTEYDFMSDTLQIAKLIMFREHFSGGLFLMYGLYGLQKCPEASIRLEVEEFLYLVNYLKLKDEFHVVMNKKDIAFILAKLFKQNAFALVSSSREHDMEGQNRADMIYNNQYEFYDDEHPRVVRPRDWMHNHSKDLPKEMKDSENDFLKMKRKIKAVFPYLNLSLEMVNEDITTTVLRSLTQAFSMAEPGDAAADTSIGARRLALKNRKRKIKHRYQMSDSEEEPAPVEFFALKNRVAHDLPQEPKRKKSRGAPRGVRKLFFHQAFNDPGLSSDTDEEDSTLLGEMQLKFELPDLT